MLVKDYMTRHPLMAEPNMAIVEAQRFMAENHIRHMPVVGSGKQLLGLVTRETLLVEPGRMGSLDLWEITRYLSRITLDQVMVRREHVITIDPEATIEEAARVMVENKIGCLPVVEGEVVVGIITETDMLTQLMEMLATRQPGVRVTIRMPNRRGELAKLVAAISGEGWGILSCGGVDVPKRPELWEAVVKIRGVTCDDVARALSQVEGHEIVDVREV